MELLNEVLTFVAKIVQQVGLISVIAGGAGVIVMMIRSVRNTKKSQATKLDTMFLASSSPGFSRFPIFNAPDDFGIGVYTALALEQVGAIDDIKEQVGVNLRLYPDWPLAYLSAARYYALVGDKQKARDLLSIAETLAVTRGAKHSVPQLEVPVVASLIASEATAVAASTSLKAMYYELRKKPHLLLLARSTKLAITGICLLFLWIVLLFAIKMLTQY